MSNHNDFFFGLPWCKILPPKKMLHDWADTDHFPWNTKKFTPTCLRW
jgi:hypothetical protein